MSSPTPDTGWYLPAGATATTDWTADIGPGSPRESWRHTGLQLAELGAGESREVATGDREYLVVPLSGGGVTVTVSGESSPVALTGRADVWAGPTDVAYVPRDRTMTVTSTSGGRVALAYAVARRAFPVRHVRVEEVPVELRGAGSCSRQVHNFGTPATVEADSIIACEVYTPGGNTSSYPPHKHDEDRPGVESELEEIYYFELRAEPGAGAPPDVDPIGYQRVYGTDERPIDVLAEVRQGDVVLVPHGWHGPAIAPPGYDLYYLNVMAGPGQERAWLICDDPAHGWVRGLWEGRPVDPRLPLHVRRATADPHP